MPKIEKEIESKIHCSVVIPSKIGLIADKYATRYATNFIAVYDSTIDDMVVIAATDHHRITTLKCVGFVNIPEKEKQRYLLMPVEILPKKKSEMLDIIEYTQTGKDFHDGEWRRYPSDKNTGEKLEEAVIRTAVKHEKENLRFPNVVDLLPSKLPDNSITVTFNPKFLVEALLSFNLDKTFDGKIGEDIQLTIPLSREREFNGEPLLVTSMFSNGVGIVMPMVAENEDKHKKEQSVINKFSMIKFSMVTE